MKTAAEIIKDPPRIEAGAPFVMLDEHALKQVISDALQEAARVAKEHDCNSTTDRLKKRGIQSDHIHFEARIEIEAEERGERIASEMISKAILSLATQLTKKGK